jgi:hypothetical protein
MKTLFITNCKDNELVSFPHDLEYLFIKQMTTSGIIKPSINLPCSLKVFYLDRLVINISGLLNHTNVTKSDFGIRNNLMKNLPFNCTLVINNISFYNQRTYAPTIKDLVYIIGIFDLDGFRPNESEEETLLTFFKNDIISDAKWVHQLDKIDTPIDIGYKLVNEEVLPTFIVYPLSHK